MKIEDLDLSIDFKRAYEVSKKVFGDFEINVVFDGSEIQVQFFKVQTIGVYFSIDDDGTIKLPKLRGIKDRSFTELPVTEEDIGWLKRIIELDTIFLNQNHNDYEDWVNEFKKIHTISQEELRKIYK